MTPLDILLTVCLQMNVSTKCEFGVNKVYFTCMNNLIEQKVKTDYKTMEKICLREVIGTMAMEKNRQMRECLEKN